MAFDPRARPVQAAGNFGWLHPGAGHRTPVLLCPPFGIEALASHIGWRALANRLAAQGHDVLRLDYPGTGYSPGEMLDTDRLANWQVSVSRAIDALRNATGAEQVIVIGMRLGASLAAHAVQGREDVAALVALAPIVSGRRYAREITALAQMQGDVGTSNAGIVLFGFEIAQETLDSLASLDLATLPAPAARGLVLSRSPAEVALAANWGFENAPFEGFEALCENPTHSRIPDAAFDAVINWCAALPASPRAPAGASLPPASFEPDGGLTQEAVLFGPDERLFGLITCPATLASDLGVIIANAGRNPASGWGRRGVEMARAIAGAGHATLLFDGTGIGDSERDPDQPDEVLYSPQQEDDILAAARLMRSRGAKAVYIIGSCSSAFSALHAARRDEARALGVAGLAMINLIRFHWQPGESLDVATAQSSFRPTEAYGKRLFQGETWKRMLRGDIALMPIAQALLRRVLGRIKRPGIRFLTKMGLASSREVEALGWFRALDAQRVSVAMIHTLEDPGLVELAAYFGAHGGDLQALGHVSLVQIDGGDHNVSRVSGRAELNRLLIHQIDEVAQGVVGSGNTAPRQ